MPEPSIAGRPGSPEDLVRVLRADGARDRRILAAFRAAPRADLAAAGLGRVTVMVGDGTLDAPEHAPYQAIVVAAASPHVPGPLVEQLEDGGRLVHPVGLGGREQVTRFRKEADRLVADTQLVLARFVPLVGAHGVSRESGG